MNDKRVGQIESPRGGGGRIETPLVIDNRDDAAPSFGPRLLRLASGGQRQEPCPGAEAVGQPFDNRPPGKPASRQEPIQSAGTR